MWLYIWKNLKLRSIFVNRVFSQSEIDYIDKIMFSSPFLGSLIKVEENNAEDWLLSLAQESPLRHILGSTRNPCTPEPLSWLLGGCGSRTTIIEVSWKVDYNKDRSGDSGNIGQVK